MDISFLTYYNKPSVTRACVHWQKKSVLFPQGMSDVD